MSHSWRLTCPWLYASGDKAALSGQQFAVPGTYSLAGRIIHQWLHGGGASHSSSGSGSAAGDSAAGSGRQAAAGSPESAEASAESSATVESSAANATATAKNTVLLDRVSDVQIDSGTFKYVLLRVATPDGQTKVRRFVMLQMGCECRCVIIWSLPG